MATHINSGMYLLGRERARFKRQLNFKPSIRTVFWNPCGLAIVGVLGLLTILVIVEPAIQQAYVCTKKLLMSP
jgi:hypothetical protein